MDPHLNAIFSIRCFSYCCSNLRKERIILVYTLRICYFKVSTAEGSATCSHSTLRLFTVALPSSSRKSNVGAQVIFSSLLKIKSSNSFVQLVSPIFKTCLPFWLKFFGNNSKYLMIFFLENATTKNHFFSCFILSEIYHYFHRKEIQLWKVKVVLQYTISSYI